MQFTALGVSALASPVADLLLFKQRNPSDEGVLLILSILTVGEMRVEQHWWAYNSEEGNFATTTVTLSLPPPASARSTKA